jgi:hypothetical protein
VIVEEDEIVEEMVEIVEEDEIVEEMVKIEEIDGMMLERIVMLEKRVEIKNSKQPGKDQERQVQS